MTLPNTPGFTRHLTIRIRTDRNGRRRATYWQRECMRWLGLPILAADLFIAQGLATECSK